MRPWPLSQIGPACFRISGGAAASGRDRLPCDGQLLCPGAAAGSETNRRRVTLSAEPEKRIPDGVAVQQLLMRLSGHRGTDPCGPFRAAYDAWRGTADGFDALSVPF